MSLLKKKAFWAVIIVVMLWGCPYFLYALPEGENICSGSATFDLSKPDTLSISTTSDKLIVEYNSFNIASQETVRFVQPSSDSVVLNRVVGVDPSSIMGTLSANGKIFLINPNGVLFGPGSRVDVAGLLASTLDISDTDFLNGNYVFRKSGKPGYVINQGEITAQPGGYVVLLSQAISNEMSILANLGSVVLASGEKMTLSLDDNSAISVVIDEAVKEEVIGPDGKKMASAVDNSGSILANGGKVLLTAKVLNNVFDYAINNEGLVQAKSLVLHDGVIELMAEGAPVLNSGTLEAGKVVISSKDAPFINTGTISSPDSNIKVNGDSFTNAVEGKICANGSQSLANGGKILIHAETILQQGLISANAFEGGKAGEVEIVSQASTVLDEASRTQARAEGVVGSGGRILIDSLRGNTVVNKNASIDVSAGAISGNGGFVEVSAFTQLGFYGILNGRAPPGYSPAHILFDPYNVIIQSTGDTPPPGTDYLSPVSLANITGLITVQADHDITLASVLSVLFPITFEAGNDININANLYAAGSDITLQAGNKFTVAPSVTISSRKISGLDYDNGISTANSGKISALGREITIGNNANIFAHANNSYTAGDISILAQATVSFDWSNALPFLKLKSSIANIVINAATIRGRDITIKAIASSAKIANVNWAENQKPTDEITDNVDESFFFKINVFGGLFDVRTESDVVVESGAVITASRDVLIRAEALSEITLYSFSPIFEFTKAYSSADTQAVVKSGAKITAGNDFTLAANVKNTVSFLQAVISFEMAQVAMTLSGTLAELRSLSKAELEQGSEVTAVNIEVHALNENTFSVTLLNYDLEVTTFGAALGFVVGLLDSKATAAINGKATATGDVTVLAESRNISDTLSASASVMNPIKNMLGGSGDKTAEFLVGPIYDVWNWIKGKLGLDVQKVLGDGKFNVAGTFTFGYGNNEATAYIGSSAVVNAQGNVTVKAYALDPLKAGASGSASAAENCLGGAVLIGIYNNKATAYLADNATVNAKKKLSVIAEATIPNQVDAWISGALPPLAKILIYGYGYEGMKSYPADFWSNATPTFTDIWNIIYNETMADLAYLISAGLSYIASGNAGLGKLSTSYASTSAGGDKTKYGAAGAFSLMIINNSAEAYIGKGAKVNTDVTYKTAEQSVEVTATTTTNTIDLAGNFSIFSGGIQSTGDNVAGGNAAVYIMTNSARAHIDDAAIVNAVKDITVKALINTLQIKAVEAASASKKFGVDGAVSVSVLENIAEAYIEDTAVVHADNDVNVLSGINCIIVNVVASDCEIQNSGIGVSAAVNSITNSALAFIGNRINTADAKGSVYAGRNLTVSANANTYLSVLSLALADGIGIASKLTLSKVFGIKPIYEAIANALKQNNDDKDNPPPGENKPNDKGNNFLSGLGIAGDAAINHLNSVVKAYIADGVTISVGNALKISAEGESLLVSVALAAASSKKTAVGGVFAWNDVLQTIHAYTNDVTINSTDAAKKPAITITAHAKGIYPSIAIGASVTKESAVTGAVQLNWLNNDILAALGDNTKALSCGDITIDADNLIVFVNVGLAPAVAYEEGANFSAAGVFAIAVFTNAVKSYIGANADVASTGNIVIKANQLTVPVGVVATVSVAIPGGSGGSGGGSGGTPKLNFTLAATLDSKTIVNTIAAFIGDSAKVLTSKNILIDAKDVNIYISVAGGFGGGHKGAGVSVINNDIIRNVSAYIGKKATVEALGNGDISSLQYHKGIDINASAYDIIVGAAVAGMYALNDQGAGAGSVVFNLVVSTVKAYIDSEAKINNVNFSSAATAQDVTLNADNETFLISLAGGACLGDKLAFGAAAAVNVITKFTDAFISNNAIVRAKQDIDIFARAKEWVFPFVGGGSYSNTGTSIAAAIPGSVLVNFTNAYIGKSADVGANGNVALSAVHDIISFIFSGSAGLGGDKVAGGLSLIPTVVVNTTKAYIDDSATVYARGLGAADNIYNGSFAADGWGGSLVLPIPDGSDLELTWQQLTSKTKNTESFKGLSLTAFSVTDINTTAVGGTISGGWAVTGALSPTVVVNDTQATVGQSVTINGGDNSSADASQSVRIQAFDHVNINSLNGEVTFAGNGTGLGAATAAIVIYKNARAWVGDSSTINAKDTIRIASFSGNTVNALDIGLAIASSYGLNGSLGLVLIINSAEAGIGTSAVLTSGKDVIISAESVSHVLVVAGAGSIGGQSGWGGSIAPVIIVNNTKAELGFASDVDAGHDVTVKAKSTNDIESIVVTGAGGSTAGVAGSIALNWIESNTIARISGSAQVNKDNEVTISVDGQHVTVSAEDRAEIFVIAGTFGGGGTTGVGASLNIDVLRGKANAMIGQNAQVYARDAVTVSALGYKNVKAVSIAGAGGGSAGVAGAVTIIAIGSKFEDDVRQFITGEDDNGNAVDTGSFLNTLVNSDSTRGLLGKFGDLPVGEQGSVVGFIRTKSSSNILDFAYALIDEPLGDTQASIAAGANVSSLGPIQVIANDDIRIYAAGGAFQGAGTAAVGGAGMFVLINNACKAFIGDNAIVNTPGALLVRAKSDEQIYDGTVSAGGSGAAAVLGSLTLNVIFADTYAYIGNGAKINKITLSKGAVTVEAASDTLIVALGGSIGGAGVWAVGGNAGVNAVVKDTLAYISDNAEVYSGSDIKVVAVSNQDLTAVSVSGGGAGAVSVMGALSNNDVVLTTEAFIGSYAVVDANGNVLVSAEDNTKITSSGDTANGSGAFTAGAGSGITVIVKKVSARINDHATVNARGNGAVMNVYTGELKPDVIDLPFIGGWFNEFGQIVEAIISHNGSRNAVTQAQKLTTAVSGLAVTASSTDDTFTLAAGLGGAIVAITGTGALQVIVTEVEARIGDNTVINADTSSASSAQKVYVSAGNHTEIFFGTLGVAFGKVGATVAITPTIIIKKTLASIGGNVKARGDITARAVSSQDIDGVTLAVSPFGLFFAGAGSIGVNVVVNATEAYIAPSAIITSTGGDLIVFARDDTEINSLIGSGAFGVGGGVGVSIGVKVIANTTKAYIGDNAVVNVYDDILIEAQSNEDINAIVAAGGLAGLIGASAAIEIDVLKSTTMAYIGNGAKINQAMLIFDPTQSVTVRAIDNASVLATGGGASVTAGAGFAGFLNVIVLRNSSLAYIGADSSVQAAYDVLLDAQTFKTAESYGGAVGASLGTGIAATVNVAAIGGELNNDARAQMGSSISLVDGAITTNPMARQDWLTDYDHTSATSSQFDNGTNNVNVAGDINAVASGKPLSSTQAFIGERAQVVAGHDVIVKATDTSTSKMVSGVFIVGTTTTGGAVAVNVVNNTAAAYIDLGAVVNAGHNVEVLSKVKEYILTVAGSGSIGILGVGEGSIVVIVLNSSSLAYIADGAFVNNIPAYALPGQSVMVKALSDSQIEAVSGSTNASLMAGFGIANANVVLGKSTTAYIGKNASVYALGDITVEANATDNLDVVSASLRAALAGTIGGSVLVTTITNTTKGYIDEKAKVEAGGTLKVAALENTDLVAVSGSGNVGVLGLGIGGAVTTLFVNNTTSAFINQWQRLKADSVLVKSENKEFIDGKALAGSVGGIGAGAGAVTTINSTSNSAAWISTAVISDDPYSNVTGTITVNALCDRSNQGLAVGTAVALVGAVGLSWVDMAMTGNTKAYVDKFSHIGDLTGSSVGGLSIYAKSKDKASAESVAPAGGIVAGDAAIANARVNNSSNAYIGEGAIIKVNNDVTVLAASDESALASAIGMAAGIGATGRSSASATVTDRVNGFTNKDAQITATNISVQGSAKDYASASAVRAAAGGLVEGDLTSFATIDTQSLSSLGENTKLTAANNVTIESVSDINAHAGTTNYSVGALSNNKAEATTRVSLTTKTELYQDVEITADYVTIKAYVPKLYADADAYSKTLAAASLSTATSKVAVTSDTFTIVNDGVDITGNKKINIIASLNDDEAKIKSSAKAEIIAGVTGTVAANSDANVALNAKVDAMKGSILRTDELYVEASTSYNQQISFQRIAVASANTVVSYITTFVDEVVEVISKIPIIGWFVKKIWRRVKKIVEVITVSGASEVRTGNFSSGNSVVLNSDIYQSSSLSPRLVVNSDGSFLVKQNIDAYLSGNTIVVDNILNGTRGKITVVAPSGSVSGNPTLYKNTILSGIDITNNSDYDLIINDVAVVAPYAGDADFDIQSAVNTLDVNIVTTSVPSGINITNNENSDVIFVGTVDNASGSMSVINNLGNILSLPSAFIEVNNLILKAHNGAIGSASSRFNLNLVRDDLDAEILCLANKGVYLGLNLFEYKNSDVASDYQINRALLKGFLAGDVLDLALGKGSVFVPVGSSVVARERMARYSITDTASAGGNVDIALANNALFDLSGILESDSNITVNSLGALRLAGIISANDTIQLTTIGALTQESGAIKAKNLQFNAGGPVTLDQPNNEVATVSGRSIAPGDIRFTDKNDLDVGAVRGLSGIQAGAGNIMLNTLNGFMRLSQAVNAGAQSVFLGTAEAAEIVPAGIMIDAPLIGSSVKLVSADGIAEGLSGAIFADALTIDAGALTEDAAVELNNPANNVNQLAVAARGAGKLDFSYIDADELAISALDGITGIALNGGLCSLTAGGLLRGQGISGTSDVIAGHLSLLAAGGITLETSISSLTGLNNLSGDIDIVNHGDLFAQSIVNNAGAVKLTANSDLIVGDISGSSVILNAASGSILDDADEANKIRGSVVDLTALVDIGDAYANGDIDVAADSLAAKAEGNIYLEEEDGASFSFITAGGKADVLTHGASTISSIIASDSLVFRTTSGDIFLSSGALTSLNAGVGLFTNTGSILASGPGPHVAAAGDSELFAPLGSIGVSEVFGINPLDVKIDGMLLVTLGAIRISLVSGYMSGTLPAQYSLPILFPVSYPQPLYPFGRVYFNGIKIWPPTMNNPFFLAYLAQTYNALVSRFTLPDAAQLSAYQINVMELMEPVYFYHPLAETDAEAFEQFSLGADAYQFIDGALDLIGHDGLLQMFEELDKRKKKPDSEI